MTNFTCPVSFPKITSDYGWRTLMGKREWHQGLDLVSKNGGKVPIYAAADGEVIYVGVRGSYGNIVLIQHKVSGKRMDTNYAHLDSYSVKVGEIVKQGQQIGIMGTTGASTGIHLHFEIHDGEWATGQPNAVNPLLYITLEEELSVEQVVKLQEQINKLNETIKALQSQLNNKIDAVSSANVGTWAKDAYEWAKQVGITDGSNPAGALTRQQLFVILNNYNHLPIVILNNTGRIAAKELIRKAVAETLFTSKHENVDTYNDSLLISYSIAYLSRKLRSLG